MTLMRCSYKLQHEQLYDNRKVVVPQIKDAGNCPQMIVRHSPSHILKASPFLFCNATPLHHHPPTCLIPGLGPRDITTSMLPACRQEHLTNEIDSQISTILIIDEAGQQCYPPVAANMPQRDVGYRVWLQ